MDRSDQDPTESLSTGLTPKGPTPAPAHPERIGRYQIEGVLGTGGMGIVYRARDPQLGRAVAIKVVRARSESSVQHERLLREAQALASVQHPGIVPVFDVGILDEGVFVVMPLATGGTLGAWMRAEPRPWREVRSRFVAAGRGLAAAHVAGLVHRDFKPDNVLLGAGGEVQVADFGLVRAGGIDEPLDVAGVAADDAMPTLTATGELLGTPGYMAPEQLRGAVVDARADQFSFCVSLHEALYGERPFDAGSERGARAIPALLDQILAHRVRPARAGRAVPSALRAALLRGLRSDPAERWPSMDALLAQLERSGRRRAVVLGAVAIGVLGAGLAAAIAMSGDSPRRPPISSNGPASDAEAATRPWIDPPPATLAAYAEGCKLYYDVPLVLGAGPHQLDAEAEARLGLTEAERAAVNRALREQHAGFRAVLVALYAEATGDASRADGLTPGALARELEDRASADEHARVRQRLSRERAGLAEPPADLAATTTYERYMRAVVRLGAEAEALMTRDLGPARARELRWLTAWFGTEETWGCPTRL